MALNEKQQALVDAPVKQLTIGAAMAGTGKSTTMVARAQKILTAYPSGNLLIISFTKLSARDLRNKLKASLTNEQMRRVITGTFHSVMGQIIRDNALAVGLQDNFTIIDESSANTLYKRIIETKIGIDSDLDNILYSWVSDNLPSNPIKFTARELNIIISSIGSLINMATPSELDRGNFSKTTLNRFRKSHRRTYSIKSVSDLEKIAEFCYNVFKESLIEARKANVITCIFLSNQTKTS